MRRFGTCWNTSFDFAQDEGRGANQDDGTEGEPAEKQPALILENNLRRGECFEAFELVEDGGGEAGEQVGRFV